MSEIVRKIISEMNIYEKIFIWFIFILLMLTPFVTKGSPTSTQETICNNVKMYNDKNLLVKVDILKNRLDSAALNVHVE